VLAEVENRDDVAVGEVADRLRFLQEPIAQRLVGNAQQLDRHLPADAWILRFEDHTHPASADAVDDFVAANRSGLFLGHHSRKKRELGL
jgi:hypothetical protein